MPAATLTQTSSPSPFETLRHAASKAEMAAQIADSAFANSPTEAQGIKARAFAQEARTRWLQLARFLRLASASSTRVSDGENSDPGALTVPGTLN